MLAEDKKVEMVEIDPSEFPSEENGYKWSDDRKSILDKNGNILYEGICMRSEDFIKLLIKQRKENELKNSLKL